MLKIELELMNDFEDLVYRGYKFAAFLTIDVSYQPQTNYIKFCNCWKSVEFCVEAVYD